jgi:DNA invertase Pin-like site-specific DNA recombinase
MKYGYVRVSTVQQHEDRQMVTMEKYEITKENIYMEKISGKNTDRPELQKLLSMLKEGDTLIVHDFSRLSRSTADLLKIVDDLNARGVTLISNKENLDTSTPTGKLMLTMIGAINEFERTNMLERQLEGISLCKKRGGYIKKELDMDLLRSLKADVDKGLITVTTAAEELGITRRTWYLRTKSL